MVSIEESKVFVCVCVGGVWGCVCVCVCACVYVFCIIQNNLNLEDND